MISGKCPECKATVTYVRIEAIDVRQGFQSKWKGISLICGDCSTVLGVSIDPIAIRTDVVNAVVRRLKA